MTSTGIESESQIEELLIPILEYMEKGDLVIPTLPHVANQVLNVTNSPDSDASQLTALIEQDLALASRILQVANSPASGARYPIESLHQAIAWIGLNSLGATVISIVLQTGVFN